MDFENVKKFILEKWEELLEILKNLGEYLQEKWEELLEILKNFGEYLQEKLDTLVPSDVRESKIYPWLINVALPVTAGILFLILFFFVCKKCCGCCCARKRGSYKMMKAPGRDFRMRRSDFESNPQSYFRSLRGSRAKTTNTSSGDDNLYLRYGLLDP